MSQTVGYTEYKDLLDIFVQMVQKALGDQVVSIVLYGSVGAGIGTSSLT